MVRSADSLTQQDRDNIRNAYLSLPFRIGFTSVFCGIVLVTTILYAAYRKRRAIQAHSVSLIIAQTVTIFIGTPLSAMQMATYGAYPCFFAFIGLYYGLGMWCFCVVARAVRLYQIFLAHHAASKRYRDISLAASLLDSDRLKVSPLSRSYSAFGTRRRNNADGQSQFPKGLESGANKTAWLIVGLGFVVTTIFFLMVFVATDYIEVADDLFESQDPSTVIGIPGKTKRGVSCNKDDPIWWPGAGLMVAYWLIFAPGMIYALRNMNDTYGIRLDLYITSLAAFPSFIAYFVISTFTWHYVGFGPNDVIYIIFGVSHTMSVLLPLYWMFVEERTRGNMKFNLHSFEKVLKDPTLFRELQRIAIRDFCSEQTIFIQEVQRFRAAATEHLGRNRAVTELPALTEQKFALHKAISVASLLPSGKEMYFTPNPSPTPPITQPLPAQIVWQSSAILDVFVRPGSEMEINLSAPIRQSCIDQVESGNIPITVFDAAYVEVANSLFLNTYPKLLRSVGKQHGDAAGRDFEMS